MAREFFEPWPNRAGAPIPRIQADIDHANRICAELRAQGYDITLRQLYYQFVARGLRENTKQSYDNLGATLNQARLSGLMDWDYLVDRTRNLQSYARHSSPSEVIRPLAYGTDRWAEQDFRVEVWVEKEALVGVVEQAAGRMRLPFFACRGYVSQSELYAAAMRHLQYQRAGQNVIVVHLGDHDPSGIDMTRDVQDRLLLFGANTEVRRIALNMDQVEQYSPPPNPAKLTDSRSTTYVAEHGFESWELDALEPQLLEQLILDEARTYVTDDAAWERSEQREQEGRLQLTRVRNDWDAVVEWLDEDDEL